MNNNLVLVVDSGSDLPLDFINRPNVIGIPMNCNFKGNDVEDDFGKTLKGTEFFNAIREGELPTTSQINIFKFEDIFRKLSQEGKSVIYLGLSSGLTGTSNNAEIAKLNIKEELPDSNITVIDTLCASMGIGLLAYLVYELMEQDKSKDDIVAFIEETKLKINHYFTPDDLNHLKRGGRVSPTAATVGTLLHVKPIMHMDNEGKLIPLTKVRGRKKAIMALAEKFIERTDKNNPQLITISHGDCYEEAKILEDICRENGNVKDCVINYLGPTIGSHTGAGLLSLFFISNNRE